MTLFRELFISICATFITTRHIYNNIKKFSKNLNFMDYIYYIFSGLLSLFFLMWIWLPILINKQIINSNIREFCILSLTTLLFAYLLVKLFLWIKDEGLIIFIQILLDTLVIFIAFFFGIFIYWIWVPLLFSKPGATLLIQLPVIVFIEVVSLTITLLLAD
jgi:hypothetical protein